MCPRSGVKARLHAEDVAHVTVLDALTYAGHIENLGEAFLSPKLTFVQGNVLDADLVGELGSCRPRLLKSFTPRSCGWPPHARSTPASPALGPCE